MVGDQRRILVVEHEDDSGASLLGERAEQRGFALDVVSPAEGIPRSAFGYAAVMPMGASPSVNDAEIAQWLDDEVALLQDADRRGIPVLGICFGAQALAVALGGSVTRATRPEIGWFDVESLDTSLIESGPWFEWHVDAITPPRGATVLATTDVCVQAYRLGRHLAVQFHPEVTDAEVRSWCAASGTTLSELGLDADELLAQTERLRDGARARAFDLFDRFLTEARVDADQTGGAS